MFRTMTVCDVVGILKDSRMVPSAFARESTYWVIETTRFRVNQKAFDMKPLCAAFLFVLVILLPVTSQGMSLAEKLG